MKLSSGNAVLEPGGHTEHAVVIIKVLERLIIRSGVGDPGPQHIRVILAFDKRLALDRQCVFKRTSVSPFSQESNSRATSEGLALGS